MNPITPQMMESSMVLLSTEIGLTRFGISRRPHSLAMCLKSTRIRMTFSPPAVDPAQPPMAIMIRSSDLEKRGHWSKSAVPKPVVVRIAATWKPA